MIYNVHNRNRGNNLQESMHNKLFPVTHKYNYMPASDYNLSWVDL